MEPVLVILLAGAALLVGVALGWMVWGRAQSALEAKFRAAITDLAHAQAAADQLAPLREEVARLRADALALAALKAQATERDRAHAEALATLNERFGQLAKAAVEQSHQQFIERAKETFTAQQQQASHGLKELLQPVHDTLKRYEEGLGAVEKQRIDAYAGLREQIDQVRLGQTQVREEAAKLVNALRSSPKARGRWGEQQLKNVLEMAGLSTHADFRTEVSVDGDDGKLRPDVIVNLPGGRCLVIDAKCSLNAYLDAADAVDENARAAHLAAHARALRTHADQLGRKAYWDQFDGSADYVVMFIPGEHFLAAALEQDQALWEWAFERKVLMTAPTHLVAIARTVAAVWRQEKMEEQARTIGELGKELYARLSVMGGHVARLGKSLDGSVKAYNDFVGSLESKVLTQAQRFEALNVDTGKKAIDALPPVETATRPLAKLASPDAEAAE